MTKYKINIVENKEKFPLSWCQLQEECWYERRIFPESENEYTVLFLKGKDHTIFIVDHFPLRLAEVSNASWLTSKAQYRKVNVTNIEFEIER